MIFVEVKDSVKNTNIMLNMENVISITPFSAGGCVLTLSTGELLKVTDNYSAFTSFIVQKVTGEAVATKVAILKDIPKEPHPKLEQFTLPTEKVTKKGSVPGTTSSALG